MKTINKGFTLIELIFVIAILGILAALALPQFIEVQDQANDASVEGTGGALAAAVALFRAQWFTNNTGGPDEDGVEGFGLDNVTATFEGFPADVVAAGGGGTGETNDTPNAIRCSNLFSNLLQGNAPNVDTVAGAGIDYVATSNGNECTWTYQLEQNEPVPSFITYNLATGEVDVVLSPN